MVSVQVDELDCRLLKSIFTGGTFFWRTDRIVLGGVAEEVGVHRNTVLNRLRRLEDAGAFLPMAPSIPSRALGMWSGRLGIRAPTSSTEGALERIFALEGVFRVVLNHGLWTVTLVAEDDASLRAKARVVPLLSRTEPMGWESMDPAPGAGYDFDATTARIVAHLLRAPQDDVEGTASALSISARTVARHIERLRREGALVMRPSRGGEFQGLVFTYARVELEAAASGPLLSQIEAAAPQYYFRHLGQNVIHLYLYASSQREAAEQLALLRALAGVARVDPFEHAGFYPSPGYADWIARLVLRRAR